MFKIIIAGSRNFTNYDLLASVIDSTTRNIADELTIISGTAKGADTFGERYAAEHQIQVHKFPAEKRLLNRVSFVFFGFYSIDLF